MTTGNGGTKDTQGLLRIQSIVGIYCSNIYSNVVIFSLVGWSHQVAVSLGQVLSLWTENLSCYPRTSPGHTESK